MKNLEIFLGAATSGLLNPQYVVAVARHKRVIHWLLCDRDNLILDWGKWRDEFVLAGYQVPDEDAAAPERSGIVVVNQDNAREFLSSPVTRRLDKSFLRDALLERFSSAQSWWDVEFLFPIAFVNFDEKRFAGFYHDGPRLERFVPAGWVGEFVDFANTYPETLFPTADKFWIVNGKDLLQELNERGRDLESKKTKW